MTCSGAILLKSDIYPKRTPPNFPLMVKDFGCPIVYIFLTLAPIIKILLHAKSIQKSR